MVVAKERISERIDEHIVDVTVPQEVAFPQVMAEWVADVPCADHHEDEGDL